MLNVEPISPLAALTMEPHPFIEYNYTKHHLNFLKNRIDQWRSLSPEQFRMELLKAGDNLFDFYTGDLSADGILNQCETYLKKEKLNEKGRFDIIMVKEGFRKVQFSDGSEWIIRKNDNPTRFVHLHPARYSKYTIRIKATTLKTVVALLINEPEFHDQWHPDLDTVNKVRKEYLGISPIKSLSANTGIKRLLCIFSTGHNGQ